MMDDLLLILIRDRRPSAEWLWDPSMVHTHRGYRGIKGGQCGPNSLKGNPFSSVQGGAGRDLQQVSSMTLEEPQLLSDHAPVPRV